MKMDNYVYVIATNARYGCLVLVVTARNVTDADRDLAAHQHRIEKIFPRLGEMTTTADVLSLLKRKYTDCLASPSAENLATDPSSGWAVGYTPTPATI